ncbi:hypothetical protein KO488_06325 [Poseidonibacter lekithochrous]|uniref:RCC1 domain-containing protein n=1 Tax=Poseidonibacter TaxID=2321187 RepID=UPI001C07F0E8|nr:MULTISPECIES: RCC1 domain-containing protein [Poseidonibacter]MBU3014367.1 hypothetical protein [Poseidonibacter lekithochrous]MDO6827665.1 RCC1 domain-containing protein [Poseidonibacter sp. 1_MG-2023]
MRFILLILLLINISFANTQNISRMNALKKVIQKEEYIALAINKYILQTGSLPLTESKDFDWTKLDNEDYLGKNFNKSNPLTSKYIDVYYKSGNFFIKGVIDDNISYDEDLKYLYNFYTSRIFRVNTLAPIKIIEDGENNDSQVIYSSIQKEIVKILNDPETDAITTIKLDSQECPANEYYYELKGKELTLKFCKDEVSPSSNRGISVYQEAPIYAENWEDLLYIKAKIGDKAYAKKNGTWYEYYYQGDTSIRWVPSYLGSTISAENESENVEDLILSYIPDSKDLVFRRDGGCMLANGDIFCWGNNKYKKAGIENYGQLDTSLSPDYVNTPVMLKVQIDNITKIEDDKGNKLSRYDKKWYNNPYRVKFEKMGMNSSNVCGISPIFTYKLDGLERKIGGELYCNGSVSSTYFEDLDSSTKMTSILKKNKFFTKGKTNTETDTPVYLQDIVMVEDTTVVLSDAGDIYTFGRNYKGALGIGSDDKFIAKNTPEKINGETIFKKIFALRDIKGLGAIDEDNFFWIWGETSSGIVYNKPTLLDEVRRYNKDAIFVNTKEFVLKGVDNNFYQTTGTNSTKLLANIPSTAISVSVYGDFYTYINEDLELKASESLRVCMQANETDKCTANANNYIFDTSFNELNEKSNTVNNKDYANFANVSIFKLDSVIIEDFEDFEDYKSSDIPNGWNNAKVTVIEDDGTDEVPVTTFLGNFKIGSSIDKVYSFPEYKNNEVDVEFDFYEIDTWDYEKFIVKFNGETIVEDNFIHDDHTELTDVKDNGESLQAVSSSGGYNDGDQKFHYKFRTNLDGNGDLKIEFSTRGLVEGDFGKNKWSYAQTLGDESWGIDNVHVKVKETNKKFVCAMTGLGSKSQMYCWGNVARSIPILSTSLYDMSKITTINKLFITQEDEKKVQMSDSFYNSNGNLFLKFPTYIGGFDYGFYFK